MVITHDRYYKKGVWTSEKPGCWKKSPQTQIMERVLFSWNARWVVCLGFFAFADIRWKCNIICSHTPCLRIQSSAPNQWQLGNSRRPAKQCVSRHSAPGASSVQPFKHSTLNKRMRCDRVKGKTRENAEREWLMEGTGYYLRLYLFIFRVPMFPGPAAPRLMASQIWGRGQWMLIHGTAASLNGHLDRNLDRNEHVHYCHYCQYYWPNKGTHVPCLRSESMGLDWCAWNTERGRPMLVDSTLMSAAVTLLCPTGH